MTVEFSYSLLAMLIGAYLFSLLALWQVANMKAEVKKLRNDIRRSCPRAESDPQ